MRPSVTSVLKHYGQQYLDRFGKKMTAQQKKVLRAVMACRTEELGTVGYLCPSCGHALTLPRSCANRHCPACQHEETKQWLDRQLDRLLPCTYFLITFTVPQELREVMLAHPREGYAAMMTAAAESLKAAAGNERHVGAGQPGFCGVLHTSGRDLSYHPHCHFLVAGGVVAEGAGGLHWKPSRVNFCVPEKVLSIPFRAKLRDALTDAGLFDKVRASAWQHDWAVDSVAGNGRASWRYLAPYVFRGPVADWRVTECDWSESVEDASLILQVKPSGQRKYRPMPLTVVEFIRRWLLHVLPSRFHRVRHYGFFHSHSRHSLAEIRWLILAASGMLHYLACGVETVALAAGKVSCPCCGGPMICLGYEPPSTSFDPSQCTTRAPPRDCLSPASIA